MNLKISKILNAQLIVVTEAGDKKSIKYLKKIQKINRSKF